MADVNPIKITDFDTIQDFFEELKKREGVRLVKAPIRDWWNRPNEEAPS